MKTLISRKYAMPLGLILATAGLALSSITTVTNAQDMVINTFDSGIEGMDWVNFRSIGYNQVWDKSQDVKGLTNSGSLYVSVNWPLINDVSWTSAWTDVQMAFATPSFNSTNFVRFECDIKVDVTNSFTAMDGSYGIVELVVNDPWQDVLGRAPLLNTNSWQHFVGYFSDVPDGNYKEAIVGLASIGESAYTNKLAVWIDNIIFTGVQLTGTNQPPITLLKAPPAGLTCLCNQHYGTWQRAMIATADNHYSWNTATAASDTTTYAMNIAAFPDASHVGFAAQMFLIPGSGINGSPFSDNSIDLRAANVAALIVTELTNHTALGSFQYKVNNPGNWNCVITKGLKCVAGPLGKWRLSFNSNTNITLTAPDNTSTNFTIAGSDAALFQDPLYFYVGTEPNRNANIGEYATFSAIQINGSARPLNDNFISSGTGGQTLALNTNWVNVAANPKGISITAPDAMYRLTWPMPDPGFRNVYVSDNLTDNAESNQWLSVPTAATGWLDNGNGSRVAVIDQSALDAACGHTPTNCLFQLYQP